MEMTIEQKKALAKTRARAALQAEQVNVGEDVARSGAAGLGRGVIGIAGTPGDLRELSKDVIGPALKKVGLDFGPEPERIEGVPNIFKTTDELVEKAADAIRPEPTLSQLFSGEKPETFLEYEPKTRMGKFARTAGEFAPGVAAGPGGWLSKVATTGGGALLSEGAGQLAEGSALEPYVRFGGAILGSLAGHRASYRPTANDLLRRHVPQDLTEFNALGPEALVLDASPSMVGLAQGIAATPGSQKDLIVQTLRNREARRSDRLGADVDTAMGPPRDIDLLKQQLERSAQQQAGPMYERALANGLPMPGSIGDLVAIQMTSPADTMSLGARTMNRGIMDEVDDALAAGSPEVAGRRLHDIRKRLDAQIVYDPRAREALSSADKANQSVLRESRATVDDLLKNRYPGFAEADEVIARSKRLQGDLDYGRDALEGGKFASTPERFRADMRARSSAFVGIGMRHDVRNAMGTQANDLPAVRKKVGGDHDFNRAKIAEIFGPNASDTLANGVRREETFSRNYADIDRNSQTYQRKEAADIVRGTDPPKITMQETLPGIGLKGLATVVNALVKGASTASRQPARDALVRALITQGPQAQALLRAARDAPGPLNGAVTRAIVNALLSTTEARIGSRSGSAQ